MFKKALLNAGELTEHIVIASMGKKNLKRRGKDACVTK